MLCASVKPFTRSMELNLSAISNKRSLTSFILPDTSNGIMSNAEKNFRMESSPITAKRAKPDERFLTVPSMPSADPPANSAAPDQLDNALRDVPTFLAKLSKLILSLAASFAKESNPVPVATIAPSAPMVLPRLLIASPKSFACLTFFLVCFSDLASSLSMAFNAFSDFPVAFSVSPKVFLRSSVTEIAFSASLPKLPVIPSSKKSESIIFAIAKIR